MTKYLHPHSHSGIQAENMCPSSGTGLCKRDAVKREGRIVHESFVRENLEVTQLYFEYNLVSRTSHMALSNVRGLKTQGSKCDHYWAFLSATVLWYLFHRWGYRDPVLGKLVKFVRRQERKQRPFFSFFSVSNTAFYFLHQDFLTLSCSIQLWF